ncbi:hypothetical protein AeMF1_008346, partial [Aphanomyces euteiches]
MIHTFDTVRGDDVRLLIMNQLAFILKSWSQADLDPYAEGIRNVLAKGLHDKSESVRVKARDILCLLRDTRHETFNISQVSLSSEFGAGRTDSVVMPSLLFPSVSLHINEAVAKSWLNKVVADYAKFAGVSISMGGAGQAIGGGMPMMMQSIAAAAPVENVPDMDITTAYSLKAFLVHKFKKFSDITDSTNVHELAAGKYSTSTVVKMLSAKLPGGFLVSQLRACMAQERCFGPKHTEIAMIHSLTNAPDLRFATEADAKTWINLVIDEYGSVSSAMIPYASKSGGAVSAGVPMMGGGGSISSAALDALKAQMSTMMREQVNAYQAFMKFDSLATLKKTNADKVTRRELEKRIDLWVSEHGEYDEKGIQPKFDAKK